MLLRFVNLPYQAIVELNIFSSFCRRGNPETCEAARTQTDLKTLTTGTTEPTSTASHLLSLLDYLTMHGWSNFHHTGFLLVLILVFY